ncbi:uncharacterized protein [Misgurnus anguillicaudatus]|uniref:uncharacterized protein n=1 Tax=Misgurnus anguillicaudatus TaxID=75329 RepID=UPI003CCFA563
MGKSKFNAIWLDDVRYSGLAGASNEFEATCKMCRKTFKLGTMGIKVVESHMKSEKHRRYAGIRKSTVPMESYISAPTSISTPPAGSQTGNVGPNQDVQLSVSSCFSPAGILRAEVLWVLHTVSRHLSYKSNDNIHTPFKEMFPGSEHVQTFTCGRDKTAYIARFDIASFVKRQLITKVNEDSFVVLFDESMNKTTKNKQLDIHIRNWTTDETGTYIYTRCCGSEFLGHSTAEDLLDKFKNGIKDLCLSKMLSVSMYGPNVNWKFMQLLQQEYSEQFGGAQIQIVGSCGLHIMHNSIKSGFGVWQVDKLLKALHFLFHCAPARHQDFTLVTQSTKFPLPFCGHRWLENLPAVERAIEIWPSLVTYVDQVKMKKLPNTGSSSYDTVAEARIDPLTIPKLHFFMSISKNFQPFLTKYQTDVPMIPFLSKDLEDLVRSILRHFIQRDVLSVAVSKLVKLDVMNKSLWVSPKMVDIGMGATAALRVCQSIFLLVIKALLIYSVEFCLAINL